MLGQGFEKERVMVSAVISLSVPCATTVERLSGTHEEREVCGPDPVPRKATRASASADSFLQASHQATGHIHHSSKHRACKINSVTYLPYRHSSTVCLAVQPHFYSFPFFDFFLCLEWLSSVSVGYHSSFIVPYTR